jgi:cystathionine beta-lyase
MTHKSIPVEKRHQSGVADSLIRLSCGIEDADDRINDLRYAFQKIKSTAVTANSVKKLTSVRAK